MPEASSAPVPAHLPKLDLEWQEAADLTANNLGFGPVLAALCPEHWQRVLAGVSSRMQLRGVTPPPGWQLALAKQVGRHEGTPHAENSVIALRAKREDGGDP